jgi:hypothetical protein
MKLPNAANAVIEPAKLVDYCLSPDLPRGKHKARVFRSSCGITADHAELLRQQLLEAAEFGEATEAVTDGFGQRFVIVYNVVGPNGSADVRSLWITRHDEDFPRFISAYVIT